MHAGEALSALGDLHGAEEHFGAALRMTDASDDFEARADVWRRLRMATRPAPSGRYGQSGGQRPQPKRKLSKAQRKR